jgi:hypothetical protein
MNTMQSTSFNDPNTETLIETAQAQPANSVAEFHDFLRDIAKHPQIHAKFLNTLSFMEYMGSRKILKSQRAESITFELLSHTAEEIRHAQTFKKIALKISDGKVSSYSAEHLFCGVEAATYFQTLDQTAAQRLGTPDSWANYLLTTLLIEERANQIYPFYEEILAAAGYPGYLKLIVREENSHLQDIAAEITGNTPLSPTLLNELRKIEGAAFAKFTASLKAELRASRA